MATLLVRVLVWWCGVGVAWGQQVPGGGYYNKEGVFVPPSPGDPNYKTYVLNGRRYGQNRPSPEDRYRDRDPYERGRRPDDPRYYEKENAVPLPGILGEWRPDLQGKERPDSRLLDRDIFVDTSFGQVQGFKVYLYDDPRPEFSYRPSQSPIERIRANVSVFLGIPYAQPPVNEGRFKPPRAHRGWQLMQAVDFGPACPQPFKYIGATKGIRDMDEDCLYLNIYTPTTASGRAQLYPVMFYIHGGDFMSGASNVFPGHMMAAFYDVVVVTINYRLGVLGFLSTGDENSPGNYGILDQAMALRWVYDNIMFFNGDRQRITLFGPGAGAASAGLLMVAPNTRHMVNKVISQSGSALADWAIIVDKYRAQNTSRVYAQHIGCSIETSWKLVNCTQILGIHFEMARNGQLKYLNLNTTFNSSIMLNYRQTESAFWTMYLPTVIGRLVPTYPPSTEFWWEPREPLQIAFWSISGACLLLIVIVVICCILKQKFGIVTWNRGK